MIYIATTTINTPSLALKKFANNKKCKLIVALDKNSKQFKLKNSIILTTKFQEKKWPTFRFFKFIVNSTFIRNDL